VGLVGSFPLASLVRAGFGQAPEPHPVYLGEDLLQVPHNPQERQGRHLEVGVRGELLEVRVEVFPPSGEFSVTSPSSTEVVGDVARWWAGSTARTLS